MSFTVSPVQSLIGCNAEMRRERRAHAFLVLADIRPRISFSDGHFSRRMSVREGNACEVLQTCADADACKGGRVEGLADACQHRLVQAKKRTDADMRKRRRVRMRTRARVNKRKASI